MLTRTTREAVSMTNDPMMQWTTGANAPMPSSTYRHVASGATRKWAGRGHGGHTILGAGAAVGVWRLLTQALSRDACPDLAAGRWRLLTRALSRDVRPGPALVMWRLGVWRVLMHAPPEGCGGRARERRGVPVAADGGGRSLLREWVWSTSQSARAGRYQAAGAQGGLKKKEWTCARWRCKSRSCHVLAASGPRGERIVSPKRGRLRSVRLSIPTAAMLPCTCHPPFNTTTNGSSGVTAGGETRKIIFIK
jgi:hypothetical protein